MPPQHFTTLKDKDEKWAKEKYAKEFHFLYDTEWKEGKEKTLIARSLLDNDRHTYIERALYNNKAEKSVLSVGMFLPPMLDDYPAYEKKLIDNLGKVIYENKLNTKDLWREFDFNRTPSPFMYLDREQWKKFLREIDKQVKWRYEKFGEPLQPEKDPTQDNTDYSNIKENIGKETVTSRYCLLRANPSMTSPIILALEKDVPLTITDADTRGYYKVKLATNQKEGWLVAKSVKIGKEEEKATLKPLVLAAVKEKDIPQPEITPTMTHDQYLKWKELTDPKLIDEFVGECEPYDKGLKEIIDSAVKNDDRLTSLTKNMETENNSTINYSVTEASPGDSGHCVKPSAELNVLIKPRESIKVDPVYPDLIVPPNYTPTDYNIRSQNSIPMATLEDGSLIKDAKDFDNDQLTFDYELLNDKKKISKGKPINYLDPYPYDDKIIELEKHHPKVKIDEIEARLYESNHPGDPSSQPMAKNFALVYDAMLKQSSSIEKRLVKIENVLANVLRNQGRIGSRINVNCVYYGGQDSFGKYKTIRCLCDDRIHDASSVTLDQCLSCTRYEPILGQVYDILDDTGMNGTVFLDNMQMGYMNLDDLKNLNRVEKRCTSNEYANVNKEMEKPESQIKRWEESDKKIYIESLKKKITDEKELDKKIKEIKQEDYSFKMNWYEQDLDVQEPDVKPYPLEGIKARYKKINASNEGEESDNYLEKESVLDDSTDQDTIKDMTDLEKLNNGEWVDTREEADTTEINKYSSEDYYFEGFNITRTSSGAGSSPGGIFGAEARKKIVDKAKEIVQLHAEGKAGYSQGEGSKGRTYDDEQRVMGSNKYLQNVIIYDCSSFVSCCYKYAGLTSMYNKNTVGQCDAMIAKAMTDQFWYADKAGVDKALPGDLIYETNGQTIGPANLGKVSATRHVVVYIGDGKVAHASTGNRPVPNQILIAPVEQFLTPTHFFARPWDLIEADKKAQENAVVGGGAEAVGNIVTSKGENFGYVYSFPKAVCSVYTDTNKGASGAMCIPSESNIVAAHNMPYETVIYIKELDGKGGGGTVAFKNWLGITTHTKNLGQVNNGVFIVGDTGGPYFDFDICTNKFSNKGNMDVLVLEWGKSKIPFWSFTDAINNEGRAFPKYPDAIRSYKRMNGTTINFFKFKDKDKGLSQSSKWTSI